MKMNEKKHQPIKVFIRPRPLNRTELDSKCGKIIQKTFSPKELHIKSKHIEKRYTFDRVFGGDASQLDVYNAVVAPLINYIISGYNGTVFAYGQTGTGKTYTIVGEKPGDLNINFRTDLSIGLIPRAAAHLFTELSKLNPKTEYTVRVSFIEIYNEEVRDLLSESIALRIYDDPENKGSVCLKGVTEITVCNIQDVYEWLNIGLAERQTANTNINTRSSRSHMLFIFLVNTREITTEGEELIKTGKLQLVDLAGSENTGRSGTVDVRARETATINKSLLTLGKVIKALSQRMQHIPYRDSKLTRILQDSLGGSSRTCMIGTISPSANAWDETVSTLECAQLARSVVNCPQINVNKKQTNFLRELEEEIHKLQNELAAARRGSGFYVNSETYEQMSQSRQKNKEKVLDLITRIGELEECKKSKERQCLEWKESFEQTKTYLDTAKQELERKKKKGKENEFLLNYTVKRDEELSKTANDFLKICEISTKHEDIYHSKYQKQCEATLSNAAIAKDVTATSLHFLKDIQHLSDLHRQEQEDHVNKITSNIKHLKESNAQDLQQITKVASEMQSHVDTYEDLHLEEVLKHETTDFKESSLQNYFTSLNSFQPKRQDKVKTSLETLKTFVLTTNAESDKASATCLDAIDQRLSQKEEHFSTTKNKFKKIHEALNERQNNFQNRIASNRQERALIKELIAKTRQENEVLLKETASLEETSADLVQISEHCKENTEAAHMKKIFVNHLKTQIENGKAQEGLISDIISNVNEDHAKIQNETEVDKQNVNSYLSALITTIKQNLTHHNNTSKGVFHNWGEKLASAQENLFKTSAEHSEAINKDIQLISNSTKTYNINVHEITEKTSQEVGNLEKNITVSTHVGDTPVKVAYNYPKRIEKALPKQVLLEQMKQIMEEES